MSAEHVAVSIARISFNSVLSPQSSVLRPQSSLFSPDECSSLVIRHSTFVIRFLRRQHLNASFFKLKFFVVVNLLNDQGVNLIQGCEMRKRILTEFAVAAQ